MYPATDNHKRTLMIALPEDLSSLLRQSSRRWLVTGAAGFIGSNLVEALLAAGQDVVGLDNFATGHQRNLDEVARLVPGAGERFTMIQGDIRDRDACAKAVEGVDVVLHQAALGSVPRSLADPLTSHDVNVTGFLNMLDAARLAGVTRFIYAASSSTYGDSPDLPKREDKIGNPLSPYAVPASDDLSRSIAPYLERHDAILLENHGALTYGHDLQSAWFKMEALDYYAKVVYLAAAYGGPREFSQAEVDKLIELKRTRFPSPGRHPFIP